MGQAVHGEGCPPTEASKIVEQLTRENLGELVSYCREKILARPQLAGVIEQFRIRESDAWLHQAVQLFRMCPRNYSPAVEWHDEVGELNFTAGLSISDANDCLCILRDGMIRLIWKAVRAGTASPESVPELVSAVLKAFDCALDAQAAAYVRESQRHLSEINRSLEFRQNVFERDLALARLVQQQFIPRNFRSKHFLAEVRYVPTTGVGGDHAGIFPVSEDRLYVTICDVTGHGIASALAAEMVSAHLRPLLRRPFDGAFEYSVDPLSIIWELNHLFYTEFQPLGMLLSFFAASIDWKTKTLTYSGAGHPPPLLQCCSAHNVIELRSQNVILGASEDCVIGTGQDTVPFHEGDRVIFYTDGIMEANNGRGKMLGLSGLRKIIEEHYDTPAKQLADEILKTARDYYEESATDDMSLILLDILPNTVPSR